MKYLIEIVNKNKSVIIVYLITGILIAFLNNFNARYFQILIDKFSNKSLTIINIFTYGSALISVCILNYLDEYPGRKIEHGIFLDLKLKTLEKISRIDYETYIKLGTGTLVQRIENGAQAGKGIIFNFVFCLIRELIPSVLFSLFFIYKLNKKIMIVILSGYIVVFFITKFLLKTLYSIKERILINEEKMNHYLIRGFMEMVTFRINKRFDFEISKAYSAKKEIVNSKVKMTLIHEAFFTIFALIITVIKIMIVIYGYTISDSLTIGAVIALITLIDNAYTPIAIFNVLFVQYKLDIAGFKRYMNFLDLKNDLQLEGGERIKSISGNITFEDLSFSYDNRKIFDNLNLDIKSGEKIALVGESGSGKSTLIKLLLGLLKIQKGKILIDEYELSKVNLESYYDNIAYIPQESSIFNGTLRENIVFDKNIDDAKIIDILDKVELFNLYSKLENKLDTELGEKGVSLSGGERQRLALSRLYFSTAQIVVLDEATSAMDNLTQEKVMNSIMDLLNEKTIIAIAHNLDSIKNFDKIIALKNGEIIGQGTFSELIENNLYFKDLYYSNVKSE